MKLQGVLALLGLSIGLSLVCFSHPAYATGDNYTISGATSTYAQHGSSLEITDVQITQIAGDASSTVPVKLFVSNGELSLATTTGLVFTGDSSGSLLQFEGTRTAVNRALSVITYTSDSVGEDQLEISLVDPGEVFLEDNGHLYEYVTALTTWTQARDGAAARTKYGATGYLTTITSETESDFVAARLEGQGWMGASDAASEGDWKWVTGPESGTSFWSGDENGSVVPSQYENWNDGEPNDSSNNEDCAQFLVPSGLWNDLPCSGTTLPGYVVEYGSPGDLPSIASRNITIAAINAPTVASLSPADEAVDVAIDTDLIITFDTPVSVATGSISIFRSSDDQLIEQIAVISDAVTANNTTTVRITPTTELGSETDYYIAISSTAFAAYSSTTIYYAGIANNTTWNFTSEDVSPPTISTLFPSDGQTGIATTANLIITFDDDVTTGTGNFYLYEQGTNSLIETFNVASSTVSVSGTRSIVLDPTADLAEVTSYYVTADETAVDDTDGNSFAGISLDSIWNFVSADETGPQLISFSPVDDDTRISTTTDFTFIFDEVIDDIDAPDFGVFLGLFYLTQSPDLFPEYQLTGLEAFDSISGTGTTKLTVTVPTIDLDEETTYYFKLQLKVIDASGNASNIYTTDDEYPLLVRDELPQFQTKAVTPQRSGGAATYVAPQAPQLIPFVPSGGTGSQTEYNREHMTINQGDSTTNETAVTVYFHDISFAREVALSESADFIDAVYLPFAKEMPFILSSAAENKTVYARLRSPQGGMITLSTAITLVPKTKEESADQQVRSEPVNTVPTACQTKPYVQTPIRIGADNPIEQVKLLEQFLRDYEGADLTIDGIYGPQDIAAVITWQEKYAQAILTPWGLTAGTGHVYTTSLAQIATTVDAVCTKPGEKTMEPEDLALDTTSQEESNNLTRVCVDIEQSLQFGDQTDQVRRLQDGLKALSYFPKDTPSTGYFGSITQESVIAFQADHDIEQIGIVGPQTRAALQTYCTNS